MNEIDTVELVCSFLRSRKKPLHPQRLSLECRTFKPIQLVPQTTLEDVPNDTIYEITMYLDVMQIARLFSVSKRFRSISTERIIQRINTYKQVMKYKQWNQGLVLAASKADLPQIRFFLTKGADNLETALAKACLNGDKITIDYFVNLGAQITGEAIAHAITGKHSEFALSLLKNTQLSRKELKKPLCAAIKSHDSIVNQIRILFKQHKKSFPVKHAVCAAAESGKFGYIKYLEKLYKVIPWKEAFQAAAAGGHIDILKYILVRIRPSLRFINIRWALSPAAKHGHLSTIKWLMAKGADAKRDAQTAAAEGGQTEIVKYFASNGTPYVNETFIAAAKGNNMELIKYLFLVKPQACSTRSLSKMAVEAVKNDNIQLIEFLHSKGATFASDLLDFALQEGHTTMFHWLVAHNVTAYWILPGYDSEGRGLQIAARNGHLTLTKYLWNHKTLKSRSVIYNALKVAKFPRIKKYLEEELEKLPPESRQPVPDWVSDCMRSIYLEALAKKRLREPEEFQPSKKPLIDLTS